MLQTEDLRTYASSLKEKHYLRSMNGFLSTILCCYQFILSSSEALGHNCAYSDFLGRVANGYKND